MAKVSKKSKLSIVFNPIINNIFVRAMPCSKFQDTDDYIWNTDPKKKHTNFACKNNKQNEKYYHEHLPSFNIRRDAGILQKQESSKRKYWYGI